MTRRHRLLLACLSLAAVALAALALAHPGGLDSKGGHHDRKNGGYHYHRGPSAGAATKTEPSTLSLNSPSAGAGARLSLVQAASGSDKADALADLLVRKGLITRAEFEAAVVERAR